jgi:hypothetical protein
MVRTRRVAGKRNVDGSGGCCRRLSRVGHRSQVSTARGRSVAAEARGNAEAAAGARVDGNDVGNKAGEDVLVGVGGEKVLRG